MIEIGQVLQKIDPLVEMGFQFVPLLLEQGHLQEFEVQFIGKQRAILAAQGYLAQEPAFFFFFIVFEVEDGDEVYGAQLKQPFLTLFVLLANGQAYIEQGAVLEIGRIDLLHLHDETLAVYTGAKDIEDGPPFQGYPWQVLGIAEREFGDPVVGRQQLVQKVDQEIPAAVLFAEEFLETEIRVGVEVFGYHLALFGLFPTSGSGGAKYIKGQVPSFIGNTLRGCW